MSTPNYHNQKNRHLATYRITFRRQTLAVVKLATVKCRRRIQERVTKFLKWAIRYVFVSEKRGERVKHLRGVKKKKKT
ncbi:hypothetical protein QJS04_geneDACA000318 [Acorus gramineus]|uniref:Uncharacterized protein n=1 Tax=Acorus gramineus TaxID=55184 RepID=A0AAV9AU03_ACOGR|nr:hypothetical protein QJS04_geneDACA000318 [Acorus gramineus]